MNQLTRQSKRWTLRAALLLPGLVLALAMASGCGDKRTSKAAAAPTKGVVGKVLSVRGTVTYSLEPGKAPQPLKPGMELRAEWIVRTGPGGGVTARLSNGHRWTLAGDLSKRISKIHALTLAPVKEGAVSQLSALGTSGGKDRSAAAGLHQERTAGSKAAPTRAPATPSDAELDEVTPPSDRPTATGRPVAPRPVAARQSPRKTERKIKRRRSPSRRRAPRRPRAKQGGLSGLFGDGPRNQGSSLGGGGGSGSRRSMRSSGGGTMSRSGGESKPAASPPPPPVSAGKKRPKQLTRKQLHRVIMSSRSRLASCLKTHKVTTTVMVRLVIRGTTGRVVAVRVAGRASGDKVVRCLFGRARALRFPRFTSARQTTHAFVLRAR